MAPDWMRGLDPEKTDHALLQTRETQWLCVRPWQLQKGLQATERNFSFRQIFFGSAGLNHLIETKRV